jgi:hypothetical protein
MLVICLAISNFSSSTTKYPSDGGNNLISVSDRTSRYFDIFHVQYLILLIYCAVDIL